MLKTFEAKMLAAQASIREDIKEATAYLVLCSNPPLLYFIVAARS